MKRISYSILAITMLMNSLTAQKVGLVFSGGAAKGLAHIGVLKALEENGIPVDYIVGTSMGAVVGAFYAAGYSPEEIESLTLSPAFQNWVSGTSTEKYQYNYTKAQDNASWLTVDLLLDPKVGASINTPLANDLILNFVLSEYLGQAAEQASFDFDSLFIPFRAVAAEIFSQKVLSLDSGSLIQAARSSMAVPFFYRPIKFENQYLFDGGIYNNFPADIMKSDFKPDIIIGTNVGTLKSDEYPFEDDEAQLADALIFMFLDKTDPSHLEEHDIFLEPDMTGKTALDFKKAKELVMLGYQETIENMDLIKSRIETRTSKSEVQAKRTEFRASFTSYSFGRTDLFGFEPDQDKYVSRLFNYENGPLGIDEIRQAYLSLVSEPYFKNVYPNISFDGQKSHYVFELYLKPTAKNALSIDVGGNLSTRNISALQVGLNLNRFNRFLNTYQLSFTTGQFYESLRIANRLNFNPKNRLYVEPEFQYNGWNFLNAQDLLSDDGSPVILERFDRKVGLTVGLGTGDRSVTSVGMSYFNNTDRFSNTRTVSSDATLDRLNFDGLRLNLSYERNSLNVKQFPVAGARFFASIDYFIGTSHYSPGSTSVLYDPLLTSPINNTRNWWRLKFNFEEYVKISEKYTLGWFAESVFSSQPNFLSYQGSLNYANAFEPMFDSKTFFLTNYRAYSYTAAGIKNVYKLTEAIQLRAEFYGFMSHKGISEGANQSTVVSTKSGEVDFTGMLGLVYNTPVGPLSLRLNYYHEDIDRFGLMLSYGYTIFSKRSID